MTAPPWWREKVMVNYYYYYMIVNDKCLIEMVFDFMIRD